MIKNNVRGRVFVFIDASNIYHSFKKLNWKIDFLRLKIYLERNSDLGEVFYYTAYDPEHTKQKKFLDFLEIAGFQVRTKKVKFIKDAALEAGGFHKGNLDVELTIDAVDKREDFQSFVLFSGDGDFEALLRYMRRRKKHCVVISTKDHIALELIRQAKFVDLKKLRRDVELK